MFAGEEIARLRAQRQQLLAESEANRVAFLDTWHQIQMPWSSIRLGTVKHYSPLLAGIGLLAGLWIAKRMIPTKGIVSKCLSLYGLYQKSSKIFSFVTQFIKKDAPL